MGKIIEFKSKKRQRIYRLGEGTNLEDSKFLCELMDIIKNSDDLTLERLIIAIYNEGVMSEDFIETEE